MLVLFTLIPTETINYDVCGVRRSRRNMFQWWKKNIECIKNAHLRLLSVLIEVTNNFQTFSFGLLILFGRELTERKDAKNVYKLGQGHDITFDKFLTSFLILFPSTVSFFIIEFHFHFFIIEFHFHFSNFMGTKWQL